MNTTSYKYNELITDSLLGIISPDEQRELDLWLDESTDNKKHYNSIKEIWKHTSHQNKKYDANAALERVNAKISNFENNNVFVKKQNWFNRNKATIISMAAVFVVGLFISIFTINKNQTISYIAQNSGNIIALPDGSSITLEKDASISYKRNFNTKERKINFSGNAHFDIASNPNKPFIINNGNFAVEVLGTEFDITSNNDKGEYVVNLFSGKIMMYSIDENGEQVEKIMLLPGERGIYDNTKHRIERSYQSSSNDHISSSSQILDFNNVTLKSVAEALSEAYDIQIYLDEKYNDLRLTARFEEETLESVFNTISAIFNMEIIRIGNTVTIR